MKVIGVVEMVRLGKENSRSTLMRESGTIGFRSGTGIRRHAII